MAAPCCTFSVGGYCLSLFSLIICSFFVLFSFIRTVRRRLFVAIAHQTCLVEVWWTPGFSFGAPRRVKITTLLSDPRTDNFILVSSCHLSRAHAQVAVIPLQTFCREFCYILLDWIMSFPVQSSFWRLKDIGDRTRLGPLVSLLCPGRYIFLLKCGEEVGGEGSLVTDIPCQKNVPVE